MTNALRNIAMVGGCFLTAYLMVSFSQASPDIRSWEEADRWLVVIVGGLLLWLGKIREAIG